MDYRRIASAQSAVATAGAGLFLHAAYGYVTFDPSGPPCHFCAVAPGT